MIISGQLDKVATNRLKNMRPIPNTFAIIADTKNMASMFQTVTSKPLPKWKLIVFILGHTRRHRSSSRKMELDLFGFQLQKLPFEFTPSSDESLETRPQSLLQIAGAAGVRLSHQFCDGTSFFGFFREELDQNSEPNGFAGIQFRAVRRVRKQVLR